jgi:hypothetical protein
MSGTPDKMRVLRLQRLQSMLDRRLDNPSAALEILLTELNIGEQQEPFWEALHAAAMRDGIENELADAYVKTATGRRLGQLGKDAQADLLTHAADYYQGVLGDAATAENFLERVLHIVPGHRAAFQRLRLRFQTLRENRRLIELYALYASARRDEADPLVHEAVNMIVPLPASQPLSDDACKQLAVLGPTQPVLIEVLEAHCRKTKRFALACAVLETALAEPNLTLSVATDQRHRIIKLYMGEVASPASAIPHVEALLADHPSDEIGRSTADKLLSTKSVAARAAAALQKARRDSRR